MKMVNATIRFAETTERLDHNRWRYEEEEDRISERQEADSDLSDGEAQRGERRDADI